MNTKQLLATGDTNSNISILLRKTISPIMFVSILVFAGVSVRILMFNYLIDISDQAMDAGYYMNMAHNIWNYGVYGTGKNLNFFRVPLYPAFLSTILFFPGDWHKNIVVAQSIITIIVSVYVFLTLRRTNGVVAAAWSMIFVTSPFEIFYDFSVMSESIFRNISIILMLYVYHRFSKLDLKAAIIIGLLLGTLTLVREIYALFFIVLFGAIIFFQGRKAVGFALAASVVFGLTLAPWVLRNAAAPNGGYFVSRSIFGAALWTGTWMKDSTLPGDWLTRGGLPGADADFPDYAFRSDPEKKEALEAIEAGKDNKLRDIAVARILANPVKIITTWAERAPYMWFRSRIQRHMLFMRDNAPQWMAFSAAMFISNLFVVVFGVIGLVISLCSKMSIRIFSVPILYTAMIYMPMYNTEPRYSSGALAFMYLFDVVAALYFFESWQKSRSTARPKILSAADANSKALAPE